jgi:L-alanine-DL-glutamate epimerase-like enolase superfamily enzyme
MSKIQWSIEQVTLDLKYTWKISRNATDQKKNLIVTASDGTYSGRGEAAPNIRYDESAEEGMNQFIRFKNALPEEIPNAATLRELIQTSNVFNALGFAIESAWFHLEENRKQKSFYDLTGIEPPGKIITSYTVPIMETGRLKEFYKENKLERFPFIKLKINHENAFESLQHLLSFCENPVMVDANESFTDVEGCIRWLEKIKKLPIVLVEQLMPSSMPEELEYLKKYCPFIHFGDESMTHEADFSKLKKSFDGVNMKLMKAGGYLNGIALLREAHKAGLKTMIGCMVETTLGIQSAMRLSSLADYIDLDSFLLIKNEPFGLVKENNGKLEFTDH